MKLENKIAVGTVSVAALTAAAVGAQAQDWTGPYVGAFAGVASGAYPSDTQDDYAFEENFAAGGLVGFNLESNSGIIYGLEIAMHGTNLVDTDNDYSLRALTDVKFRIGKPIDALGSSMLLYGFGGASLGNATTDNLDDSYTAFGPNLGVGAEYMVSDKISIGLEHTQRAMFAHYTEDGAVWNGTTSFRVAVHF